MGAVAPVLLTTRPLCQSSCPLLVALLLTTQASGQIRIVAPASLARRFPETHGVVYGTTATFGAPYYGKRVLGRLLYEPPKEHNHCTAEDYDLKVPTASASTEDSREALNVVLVDRGGCTFVTKVRVAEEKGARAVIVVDKPTSGLSSLEIQKVVMADDGYGDGVHIPSVMICRSDGEKLIREALRGGVFVELAWDIPRGEIVTADFWMSSGSQEASRFLSSFKESAEYLKYRLQFVPHYFIFRLPTGTDVSDLCTREDKYCAEDPDGDGPITGAEVAEEDVRQLCLRNVTMRTADGRKVIGEPTEATYSKEFWDYVTAFKDACLLTTASGAERRFGEACSYRLMVSLGMPVADVKRCSILWGEELLDQQLRNRAWSPLALRLNGWRYSGPLDPETVLRAACAGYFTTPRECDELMSGYAASARWHAISVLSFSAFVWVLISLLAMMAALFYLYRRQLTKTVRRALREEVMLEVQTQMSDYVSLQDNGTPSTSSRTLRF